MRPPRTTDRLLTTEEAAEVLGITKRALERLRGAGRGPVCTYVGRFPRYARHHLNQYLQAHSKVPRDAKH